MTNRSGLSKSFGGAVAAAACVMLLLSAGCTFPLEYHGETVDVRGRLALDAGGAHLTFEQLRIGTQEAHPCGIHLNKDGTVVFDNPPMAEKIVIGPDGIDMEDFEYFGPCPNNAAVGNGGLTVSFTSDGTMSTFNWPCASYYDHLNYLTLSRRLPRLGAKLGAGSFAGIAYDSGDGGGFTWLRDEGWSVGQEYLSRDDNVLVTTYINPSLGLSVTGYDFVPPDRDVLVRRFDVKKEPGSPVRSARLIYYENFDPCLSKIPLLPVTDWLLDAFNDHAAFYDPSRDALVHYKPKSGSEKSAAGGAGDHTGPGIYIAVSADRTATRYQCGFDARGLGGSGLPLLPGDAYYDAMDGTLSGSRSSRGHVNAALSYDLGELEAGSPAATTIYMAASSECETSLELLGLSKAEGFEANLERTRAWWREWLSAAVMPDTAEERILDVYKRSLIALKMTQDPESGAVVVSPARQPPFGEDWPRDGCYINYALDAAGYHGMARKHMEFYRRVQRPGGTWGMCYYSDGMEGGPLVLQSDTVGHIPWAMWEHYLATRDREYLRSMYPAMCRTSWWSVLWRDPSTGLPLPTFEDDSYTPVQGVEGATSVYMGLTATIEASKVLGRDFLAREFFWKPRVWELKKAIEEQLWDPDTSSFGSGAHTAWVIWPARVFGESHPKTVGHAVEMERMLREHMEMEEGSGGYEGLPVIALAGLWKTDPAKMSFLRNAVRWLACDVATPGTCHFGEFFFVRDEDGDGAREYINWSAIPHGWNHALFVISALELF